MNIKYQKYQLYKIIQYHSQNNYPKNYIWAIFILFMALRTIFETKKNLIIFQVKYY
jgi:hypothetical protein